MALHDVDKNSEDRGSPTPNHSDVLPSEGVKAHKTISSHYTTDADTSTKRLQMQNKQIVGSDGAQQIVNFGVQTDDKFAEDYFSPSGVKLARFGQQADGSTALKFFDASGVGVARFGQYADGSIALKVAKSGQEVDTATGNNLIFNSNQDTFKIVQTGTASIVVSDPVSALHVYTTTIAHNLGFQPATMVYCTIPSGAGVAVPGLTQLPYYNVQFGATSTTTVTAFMILASVDTTNLYIQWLNNFNANLTGAGGTYNFKYYILQETAT